MDEHGTIVLVENVASDVHDKVWANPDQVLIEGGMVQLAEGKPVRHHGHSQRIRVGDDVGGIQQLLMPEAAKCASLTVRPENSRPE